MEEIRLELSSEEFQKLKDQIGDFRYMILVKGGGNRITHVHSPRGRKYDSFDLEPVQIKTDSTEKWVMAKICSCGSLFLHADIQEVK